MHGGTAGCASSRPCGAARVFVLVFALIASVLVAVSPASAATPDTNTWYQLINRHSGQALEVFEWSGGDQRLLTGSGVASNNGTKATPALTADLFGDWREEVIWRTSSSSALRIYMTTAQTGMRLPTLMHDAQYRVAVAWQNVAYNQPPHPSFYLGDGMAAPPMPNIHVR